LIVLAIIGILAAILFPAFKSAQEGGYQANCASNLRQIYQAVELYRQDEKVYPASLAFLLPKEDLIANPNGATTNVPMAPPAATAGPACDTGALTCPNPEGSGHFKGGKSSLVCADDDGDRSMVRSSYGDISTDITAAMTATSGTNDMGRYVWNYWGYRTADETATCTATNASGCAGTAYQTAALAAAAATADSTLLFEPTAAFNPKSNPLKYSLANRFAPTSTIITHCVYHRLPTASGKIFAPYEIYDPADPGKGAMAKDIILRRDGSAKVLDVSKFNVPTNPGGSWAKQNF
jgi:type II secretory pathway pseudopilin PulG